MSRTVGIRADAVLAPAVQWMNTRDDGDDDGDDDDDDDDDDNDDIDHGQSVGFVLRAVSRYNGSNNCQNIPTAQELKRRSTASLAVRLLLANDNQNNKKKTKKDETEKEEEEKERKKKEEEEEKRDKE